MYTTIQTVLIPPGKFWMGSPENEPYRYNDEKRHIVVIQKPFYLANTPITQKQWCEVMGKNPSYFMGENLNLPVEQVNHKQSIAFCQKVGARLPTEAKLFS